MQKLRMELERAQGLRAEASDACAKAGLDGVISALKWAIDDGNSPAEAASRFRSDPLDHDDDGEKGGSPKGKLATARKPKKKGSGK
jgi:hypothetical protein